MNHVTAAGGRAEAERWLGIAEKLLGARDLVGSKKFADRAMELDPLLDGVDQIVAVADVLLAAQRRVNNQVDWYSILQIDPPSADPSAVKRSYRRLALLLHPDRNKISGADIAFRLVSDAWGVLSDPYKRSLFDAELNIAAGANVANVTNGAAPSGDPEAFWTACSSCCHVHQFAAAYRNLKLRCPTCEQPFTASQIAAPPIVPGSEMYYCSWGFFPLGFPGGPTLSTSATGSPDAWKPFHPMAPQPSDPKTNLCVGDAVNRVGDAVNRVGGVAKENNAVEPKPQRTTPAVNRVGGVAKENNAVEPKPQRTTPVRNRKKMARKKVGSVESKKFPAGRGTAAKGININEEAKVMDFEEEIGGSVNADMSNIHIDLDSTDEILGNLHNIPFLKDDEAHMRIP